MTHTTKKTAAEIIFITYVQYRNTIYTEIIKFNADNIDDEY